MNRFKNKNNHRLGKQVPDKLKLLKIKDQKIIECVCKTKNIKN